MASARDVILIGILVFMVGIGLFVVNFVTNTAVDAMVAVPLINSSTEARQAFTDTQDVANDRLDYVVFGLFIGLIFGFIIAGYFVGGEPIFMFFYFILTVIGVIVSMVLANTWNTVTTLPVFGTIAVDNMPITNNLMTYLPLYTTVIGILGTILMFIKPLVSKE